MEGATWAKILSQFVRVTSDGLLNDLPGTLSLSEENLLLVVVLAGGDYVDVSLHSRSFWRLN